MNPYTPSFGTEPATYIHRYEEENKILNEFCEPDALPKSYMIIGARGAGKTVFMHNIANRLEENKDWIVVRLNPNTNMLESLMKKLSGHEKVFPLIKSAKINLSFFQLTVEFPTRQIRDEEDAISEMLKAIRDSEKKLLVVVDEATNTPSMKVFASAYQNLIGQKLPVYLLMTGLYENISKLRDEDNLTFLYRMPKILLHPLKLDAIRENYREHLTVPMEDIDMMANLTKGYSYAFQLLGSLVWEHGDYEDCLGEYKDTLYDIVYTKMWSEMTDSDKDIMYALSTSENGKVRELRTMVHKAPNEFSPYRDKLIKKGVIDKTSYGHLEIALPFLKGYVLQHYDGALKRVRTDVPADL